MLSFLNLQGCNIGDSGLTILVDALVKNDSVIYLNIGFNRIRGNVSAQNLKRLIWNCGQLKDLSLHQNKLGSKAMGTIF